MFPCLCQCSVSYFSRSSGPVTLRECSSPLMAGAHCFDALSCHYSCLSTSMISSSKMLCFISNCYWIGGEPNQAVAALAWSWDFSSCTRRAEIGLLGWWLFLPPGWSWRDGGSFLCIYCWQSSYCRTILLMNWCLQGSCDETVAASSSFFCCTVFEVCSWRYRCFWLGFGDFRSFDLSLSSCIRWGLHPWFWSWASSCLSVSHHRHGFPGRPQIWVCFLMAILRLWFWNVNFISLNSNCRRSISFQIEYSPMKSAPWICLMQGSWLCSVLAAAKMLTSVAFGLLFSECSIYTWSLMSSKVTIVNFESTSICMICCASLLCFDYSRDQWPGIDFACCPGNSSAPCSSTASESPHSSGVLLYDFSFGWHVHSHDAFSLFLLFLAWIEHVVSYYRHFHFSVGSILHLSCRRRVESSSCWMIGPFGSDWRMALLLFQGAIFAFDRVLRYVIVIHIQSLAPWYTLIWFWVFLRRLTAKTSRKSIFLFVWSTTCRCLLIKTELLLRHYSSISSSLTDSILSLHLAIQPRHTFDKPPQLFRLFLTLYRCQHNLLFFLSLIPQYLIRLINTHLSFWYLFSNILQLKPLELSKGIHLLRLHETGLFFFFLPGDSFHFFLSSFEFHFFGVLINQIQFVAFQCPRFPCRMFFNYDAISISCHPGYIISHFVKVLDLHFDDGWGWFVHLVNFKNVLCLLFFVGILF